MGLEDILCKFCKEVQKDLRVYQFCDGGECPKQQKCKESILTEIRNAGE